MDVNFVSNYEPLSRATVEEMMSKVVDFDAFTEPMQQLIESMAEGSTAGEGEYIVCSANPRRIDGVPSKNPRYLQDRPDLVRPLDKYLAELGVRLYRKIPDGQPVPLPGERCDLGAPQQPAGARQEDSQPGCVWPTALSGADRAVHGLHLLADGQESSMTGAGSEGALTKGPFNAIRTTADLNAALVSMILTNLSGFSSAAGHVGPNHRFDHDISLLIPEVWCRMSEDERDPAFLIANKYLEKIGDTDLNGEVIPSRRLGWRITERFVKHYFARIFDNPDKCVRRQYPPAERQDPASYADGVKYIMEAYQRVALQYFEMARSKKPARRSGPAVDHGLRAVRRKDETHPEIGRCSRWTICWAASGIRNVCGPVSRKISHCGRAMWPAWNRLWSVRLALTAACSANCSRG